MGPQGLPFRSKYPRPDRLSSKVVYVEDEKLKAILSKPDTELDWQDYGTLLSGSQRAGRYEELCYFLPWALRYMLSDDSEAQYCTIPVAHFISAEINHLAADGLLGACEDAFRRRFELWTATFVVNHREGVDPETQRPVCFDDVEKTDLVRDLIDALVSHPTLAAWGESLVESLAVAREAPVRSAWFLEFLRNLAEQYRYHDSGQFGEAFRQFMGESVEQRVRAVMVRQAAWAASRYGENPEMLAPDYCRRADAMLQGDALTPTRSSPRTQAFIADKSLQQQHLDCVRGSELAHSTPRTYWADLCQLLALSW